MAGIDSYGVVVVLGEMAHMSSTFGDGKEGDISSALDCGGVADSRDCSSATTPAWRRLEAYQSGVRP